MRRDARLLVLVFSVALVAPVAAQVRWQPTPSPDVSAVGRDWYASRDPIRFAGDLYYPTKRTVFFNGNVMVESGQYDGVPLYTDTTIAPYGEVLVPIGGELMESYARPRSGEPAAYRGQWTSGDEQWAPARQAAAPWEQAPWALKPCRLDQAGLVQTIRPPEGNIGIWIAFRGRRWGTAGEAVPLEGAGLIRIDDYHGFPVYAHRADSPKRIYLPTRAGVVAPYGPIS
jgi:hypothetical protein